MSAGAESGQDNSSMEQSHQTNNTNSGRGEIGGRGARGGRGGRGVTRSGLCFTDEENHSLLDWVVTILPISGPEWDQVEEMHVEKYPFLNRTKESLRRKFGEFHHTCIPTGDLNCPANVRRAKTIQHLITERADTLKDADVEGLDIADEDAPEQMQAEGQVNPAPEGHVNPLPVVDTPPPLNIRGRTLTMCGTQSTRTTEMQDLKDILRMNIMNKMASQPSQQDIEERQQ